MTQGRRLVPVALVVVVAVAAFFIFKSNGSSDKTTKGVTHIEVKGGKPVGGIKKITVNKNDPVRFTVASDVADEIHVHGYDFHKDVKKGGTITFDFPAKIDGTFVIELESRSEQIASLQVEP
ncbi:MAG: hypothetical protein ACJ77M_11245 [Thermoleophilaceae bacterium]